MDQKYWILDFWIHYVSLFMKMEIGKNRDKSNYVVIQINLKKGFTYVGNIRIYFKYIFNNN